MAGGIRNDDEADDIEENSEINITPFIDVMLVLLIIFMVAAPLSTVDLPIDLPVATAKPQPRPQRPTFITVKSDKSVAIGEAAVTRSALVARLVDATEGNRDARVFLRADKTVGYGDVLGVLDQLRAAGYLKVGLVALEAAPAARPADGTAEQRP